MKVSKRVLVIVIASVLASCASDVKKVATLKHLAVQEIPAAESAPVFPTQSDAIENYRRYIADPESRRYRAQALKRLAGLELEMAERLNESGNEEQADLSLESLSSSIQHYQEYLQQYPEDANNDAILYKLAKAYSMEGDIDQQLSMLDQIQQQYPDTVYLEEVQFRRAEILFMLDDYYEAERVYSTIASNDLDTTFASKAQYKMAWSQYKQENYLDSLDNFISILDSMQTAGKISDEGITQLATKSEASFIEDVLKVISLAFSYTDGIQTMQQRYLLDDSRQYSSLLYEKLGELYIETERMTDAALTFLAYSTAYPLAANSPGFHLKAINAYDSAGFHQQVLENKQAYVNKFDVGTAFWNAQDEAVRNAVGIDLRSNINDLASYYHSKAIKSGLSKDYLTASTWYRRYIASFPDDQHAAGINFLLAESEFEAGHYEKALTEYKKTAHDYPLHEKSAEAGYAAILSYTKLLANNQLTLEARQLLMTQALDYSIQFSYAFAQSDYAPAVITKTAETLFTNTDYARAAEFCEKNMWLSEKEDKTFIKSIQLIYAHSQFELEQYDAAERGYANALINLQPADTTYNEVAERYAASIYMQGEQQRKNGQYELAAQTYLRVASNAPVSVIMATAKYDAATMYVELGNWLLVSNILEEFRREFPSHEKYSSGVAEKLALSYEKQGQFENAARELNNVVQKSTNYEEQRLLTWQIAEMYTRADNPAMANQTNLAYIAKFKRPFLEHMEVHQRVIDYYDASSNQADMARWLKNTVVAEQQGAESRTDRTRYIAASAVRRLAKPLLVQYEAVELTVPLKSSLAVKKAAMNKTLDSYKNLMSYQIEEFTTEATYRVASIYNNFAASLMDSQRPPGLSEEELEQYEILLEEQAYPFEEKSIDIHGVNVARTENGTYDDWIMKSMEALSKLQPIRYAKFEKNELYIKTDYPN